MSATGVPLAKIIGAAPKALLLAPAGRRNQTRAAPGFGAGTWTSWKAAIATGIEPVSATKPSKIGRSRRYLRIVILQGEGVPIGCPLTLTHRAFSDGLADG